jgi:hypothetical protein|tara:strand:- start:576 stop:1049 length:474 start_codon:yes stop_codon:yes gene_type:complete
MKVIKNFYDKDKFEEIQKLILGSNFPFYFNDGVADPEQTNDFYFTHTFYKDYQPTSPYYKMLIPIIDMIKPKSLIRIKANLYPRTEKLHHHKKHEDFDFDNYGLVLSLNDCDGGTQIGDKFIPSIANQAIIFKANVPHNSTTCTDKKARFNINFNYI